MNNLLHNYRIGTRLAAAFGLVLLVMAAISIVSISSMSSIQQRLDEIVLQNNYKTTQLQIMLDATQTVTTIVRGVVLRDDAAYVQAEHRALLAQRKKFDEGYAALTKLPASPESMQLRERTTKARTAGIAVNERIFKLMSDGQSAEAVSLLLEEGVPALDAWQEPLRANLMLQVKANEEDYQAALASYHNARAMVAGVSVFALAIGALLSWLITRSLTGPLSQATRVADAIAHGDLDGDVPAHGRDEVAQLLGSMRTMQHSLQRFAAAQSEIERQHAAGEIDHRIPAAEFPGAYGLMAEAINSLAGSHIQTAVDINDLIDEYARGDLSRDFVRLPGKKARITEAMDAVKASMVSVTGEIRRLVDAAVAGDFSQRGDAQRFEFAYREMLESLNALMASADRGIGEVGVVLTAVAEGDLTRRVDDQLPGRFGQLATDCNRTVEHLTDIVGQIRGGSDAINVASGEIAAGNQDLSQRTEQQAASLEETASSMEELTSTVRQTADNARQANQLAIGAAQVAEQGGAVVGQVVNTMSAINESSRRISDIIGVIDGIAFQTNILALNAAVEAARAGEQGRGFAVVATEVRSLAQRSANAAKEIKQLITESVDKVEHGNALVEEAGKTMGEIVTSVKRVTDIIADISAASQEQSTGIEQVNQAITQMDEGTQQNAALVEEATAAARSLEEQAGQLVQTVAVFQLEANRSKAAAAPSARPAAKAVAKPVKRAAPPPVRESAGFRMAANGDANWQEF
ncbi:methyl-accepting chemotaxis protein [Luteimonas notoginsengisoli]|uniref:Methyl-accepting chemotaxis protein n=1 Tax=Luteimonas notoginsengisoli TaxID=1578200 RepID=A0ABV7UNJ4_9GAMM